MREGPGSTPTFVSPTMSPSQDDMEGPGGGNSSQAGMDLSGLAHRFEGVRRPRHVAVQLVKLLRAPPPSC